MKCSTNPSALIMRSGLRTGGSLEGEKGAWKRGKNRRKSDPGQQGHGEHPWECGESAFPEQELWDIAGPLEDKAKALMDVSYPFGKGRSIKAEEKLKGLFS